MGDGGVRGGHGDGGGARKGEDGEEWRGEGGEERGGEGGEERGGRYGGGVRGEGGGGRGSQEDLGPHQCEACREDLGDTRALFLHLQTGGDAASSPGARPSASSRRSSEGGRSTSTT